MGFFSSACSFVGSCISGAISAVSSAIGSIGSALGKGALSVLGLNPTIIEAVIAVVQMVAQLLGVTKEDETPEELGDKAMRADQKLEDFDTTEKYMNYLREDVDFDREEFDKLSDEEKLARSAIGTAISMKGISEKKDVDISLDTWATMAKLYDKDLLNKDNLDGFIDEFKDNQTDLNGYVNKDIKGAKGVEVAGKMAEAYQKLEPELSTEAINDKVLNSKIGE
jgi:hypothetical protein